MFNKVSIKAIIVLVVIAILSGVLLSVLSDALLITDAEKEARALEKYYSGGELIDKPAVFEDYKFFEDNGEVKELMRFDGAFIVDVIGYKGYKGGWVECYVIIDNSGNIEKVAIVGNKDQSFIGNITEVTLKNSYQDINIYDLEMFKVTNSVQTGTLNWEDISIIYEGGSSHRGEIAFSTGASKSETAIMNAVNSALYYIKSVYPDLESLKGGLEI